MAAGAFALLIVKQSNVNEQNKASLGSRFHTVDLPLNELLEGKDLSLSGVAQVRVNGTLQVKSLEIIPSVQPTGPKPGQMYYDQGTNQLGYYNGTNFVFLTGAAPAPQVGILGLTAGSNNVTITDTGNGVFSISVAGGTGTLTSPGGAVGNLPVFTGAQSLGGSIISQAGLTATIAGDVSVAGTLALGSALTVANGGTGAADLTENGVLVGQGAGAVTSVAAGGSGLCLLSTLGPPTWGACPGGGGGVSSLNSLTGALTLANATGAGATITIDNATTSAKGIASFNASNFSVVGGAVNTVQNIGTTATPTFTGVNTNNITPSTTLTVGATGQTLQLQGNAFTVLSATNGGSTTTVGFQSPAANVTYRFLTTGAGTYDICTTAGNCTGVGGGVTTPGGTTNRLAKFSGAQAIGDSSITDDGSTVTTSANLVVQGGNVTVGTSSQLATLFLHDGNGQTTGLQAGDSSGNLTFVLPTTAGSTNQCLKQSGTGNQLIWDACDGGGGGSTATLQAVYDNGNSITTTDNRDIDVVLADTTTDSNLDVVVADNSSGFVSLSRANGVGTADPAQLLLVNNLDADRPLPVGIRLQAAAGGITTAIDATDAEIVTAINVAANDIVGTTGNIDFTNFDLVGSSGDITTAGNLAVTSGTITSAGNINTTGGALQTNSVTRVDNSGNLTNIGNITGTGSITIASSGVGSDIVINGADIFDVQDAATFANAVDFNGIATFNSNLLANGNVTLGDTSADTLTITAILQGGSPLVFEGASADANELTLSIDTLTNDRTITLPDEGGTVCLQSSTNCGFALSSGSTSYIQNQSAIDQSADFRISGTGRAATALQSPSIDSAPGGLSLDIAGANASFVNIATNSASHVVQIGTSPAASQGVTVGSLNTGSTTTIQGGTGASSVSIQGASGATISLGTTNSNTITLGNATTTATLTLGQSTASNTINIGNATTATGNVQTVNIATSATGTGRAAVTIGNTNDSSALNLQAGTGNVNLNTVNASGGTIVKSVTSNSTMAFQVQNAASASLLTVDTIGSNIQLLGNNSPTLATWTTTTAMSVGSNTARVRGAAIAANGYLYHIGGVDGAGTTLDTVQYAKLNADGTVGAWTSTTALPDERKQFQAVVNNGYLYVIGGRNDSSIQSTVYYAKLNTDGTVGSWSSGTALTNGAAARFTQGAVAYNGYIYIIGGFDSGVTSQSTVYYIKANPDGTLASTWNTTSALPVGLSSINGAVIANGYVYITGGFTTIYEDDIYYAKLNADGTLGSWNTASAVLNASGGSDENLRTFVANGYLYVVGGDLNDRVVAFQLGSDGSLDAGTILTDFPLNPVGEAASASANGYFYVLGGSTSADGGGTARNTVYYTGGSRVKVGGNLDLVGYSGENLAEGRTGGQLTSGNATIVGTLQVQDAATFMQDASVGGSLRVGSVLSVGDSTSTSSSLNVTGVLNVTGLQPSIVSGSGTAATNNVLTAGKGGNTTGTTGQTGGTGGGWVIAGGEGGDAPSGSTNGSGGSIILQGGAAGVGAGGGNFRGNVIMQGSGGYVGIGTLAPGAFLHISASDGLATDLFKITDSTSVAVDVFRVQDEGAVTLKNRTNSAAAFQIQNATSLNVFTVDSLGSALQVGSTVTDNTAFRLGLDSFNDVNDPPGFNGAMYYNSAWQQYRCYRAVNSTAADGAWEPCGINPIDRGFMVEDEFLGGYDVAGELGQLGWVEHPSSTVSNFNYNTGGLVPTADHPGMLEISTGGSSGNGSTLTLDGDGGGAVIIAKGNVVKTTVGLDTTLANSILRVGLHSELTTSTRPVSGVWWEAAPSVNAKWQYCYGNGTTATCAAASSNANIAATQWYRLEIRVTATGTNTSSVEFFQDGIKYTVSGVTVDTTNRVNPAISCFNSTAASRDCDIDYFQFRGVASAAR